MTLKVKFYATLMRRHLLKLIPIVMLVVVVGSGTAYGMLFPEMTHSLLVPWSDFHELEPNIYVAPDMPIAQREQIIFIIEQGRNDVTAFFGNYTANPVIIAGHTIESVHPYGISNKPKALAHKMPLGTWIVLGPNGLNRDVVAHELAHAELHNRLTLSADVPTWFGEGLAAQLDHRPEIGEENWRRLTHNGQHVPSREQLFKTWTDEWGWEVHYGTARYEVQRWLTIVKQKGLFELITALNSGAAFEATYINIERRYQSD